MAKREKPTPSASSVDDATTLTRRDQFAMATVLQEASMNKPSEDLYKFLKKYAKWAYEDGAPEGRPFTRALGLCYNCDATLKVQLTEALFADFGPFDCPFGISAYAKCTRTKTQHLDQNRKAWVLKKIEEYESG